jgi:hypothetical protein
MELLDDEHIRSPKNVMTTPDMNSTTQTDTNVVVTTVDTNTQTTSTSTTVVDTNTQTMCNPEQRTATTQTAPLDHQGTT